MTTQSRVPFPVRLLSAALVAAIVLAGIWVTGGLLTNDFELAMALTAAWIAFAGLVCALIAWRRRDLRWPVLGAFVVTAAVVGVYLGRSQLVDDVVDERVVRAAPAAEGSTVARNVLLARGAFAPVAHSAEGTASAIRTRAGARVLTLTRFSVDNGPDLRVYLVEGPARSEAEVKRFEDLGALKGNKGDQQYALPRGVDLRRYSTVVIWCRAFSVEFARAPLVSAR